MRSIKFRAWDKEKKYMVYDNDTEWNPRSYPVWVSHKGIVYCTRLEFKPGEGNFEFDAYHWENVEIMQYTGLGDKNGKDVAEQDIYRFIQGKTLVVPYMTDHVAWYEFLGKFFKFNGEVIGNIYENPELLQIKNK